MIKLRKVPFVFIVINKYITSLNLFPHIEQAYFLIALSSSDILWALVVSERFSLFKPYFFMNGLGPPLSFTMGCAVSLDEESGSVMLSSVCYKDTLNAASKNKSKNYWLVLLPLYLFITPLKSLKFNNKSIC